MRSPVVHQTLNDNNINTSGYILYIPRSSDPFYIVTYYIYNGSLLPGHIVIHLHRGVFLGINAPPPKNLKKGWDKMDEMGKRLGELIMVKNVLNFYFNWFYPPKISNTTSFINYRKYILQTTQPSQHRCTQLQYRFAAHIVSSKIFFIVAF